MRGLRYGRVEVVASDPAWATEAAQTTAELRAVLGESAIEHVGSTAVPGLPAKPILDIAVAVPDPDRAAAALRSAGYVDRGDRAEVGDRLLHRLAAPEVCTVIVHVVREGHPAWQDWLVVRDRLRCDPVARDEYAALKCRLAREFPDDRTAYSRGKAEFLRRLIAAAPPRR